MSPVKGEPLRTDDAVLRGLEGCHGDMHSLGVRCGVRGERRASWLL